MEQARRLRKKLRALGRTIKKFFVSPANAARQTARTLASDHDEAIVIVKDLYPPTAVQSRLLRSMTKDLGDAAPLSRYLEHDANNGSLELSDIDSAIAIRKLLGKGAYAVVAHRMRLEAMLLHLAEGTEFDPIIRELAMPVESIAKATFTDGVMTSFEIID